MSPNSENGNKIWKIVARFLPLLTLLVSVLILSKAWSVLSVLLESLTALYKPMIVIIILLTGVSLLSFLLRIYMYVDPGKTNKTWKVVAWSLLLPALLASVPILVLIVNTWYPKLLCPLRSLFEDRPIITLLAGVSLFLFLLQIHMQVGKIDKTWRQVVACFVLPFALLVFALIPILIIEIWHPELLTSLKEFIPDKQIYKQIIVIITLLVGMSLLLFLIQKYMNKDPKKDDKTWKIVTRFLLLPTLLISVLILVVETWYPVLGYLEHKPIIAIIILLACVSLLSFLMQRYMIQSLKKGDNILEIGAYLVHFAFHLAARFLILLGILATFLIPLLILILILIEIHRISWKEIKDLSDKIVLFVQPIISWEGIKGLLEYGKQIISWVDIDVVFQIASLVTSLGLFLFFINREELYKPLLNIIGKIIKVFQGIRRPKVDVKESLKDTWIYDIKFIWPSIKKTFTETLRLIPAVFVLYIILVCGHFSTRDHKKWQKNVTENLDSIRTDTADLILLRSSGLSPAYLSEKGDTISFSLIYPPQGNLTSKKGICPEGDNLIWLQLFKQAILKCAEDSQKKQQPLKLKVQGVASSAPVSVKGDTTNSDSLNCEIANQRAEALIYFLTTEPYDSTKCKSALENDGGSVTQKLNQFEG